MRFLNQLVGALVEAWGEVRVQKARVVLSLVGVVAAVAAMSTVIALGDLIVQSNTEMMESWSGRSVTLTLMPQKVQTDQDGSGVEVFNSSGGGTAVSTVTGDGQADGEADGEGTAGDTGWTSESTGIAEDPVGAAMGTVADRFSIPYWSRGEYGNLQLAEMNEVMNRGTFHGMPVAPPEYGFQDPQVQAVDPAYATIFRLETEQGRWLRSGDVNQRVTPVVINAALWEYFGSPDIRDPLVLSATGTGTQQLRVVGVLRSTGAWESPVLYLPYDSWQIMKPTDDQGMGSASMYVWAGEDQADEARTTLPAALSAVLGEGWQVDAMGGEDFDSGQETLGTIRTVIMAIGAIVILLGALGLLNVAIVTVRQRIREIGIRRAMGASATRVFFAVFLESVVATFVAGVIGVGLAIVILRLIPLEGMGIYLQERPPFPTSAAVAGVGIATAVGALCGIIPALAAIRVRPIDAIRY